jgi:hypothetical protein
MLRQSNHVSIVLEHIFLRKERNNIIGIQNVGYTQFVLSGFLSAVALALQLKGITYNMQQRYHSTINLSNSIGI